ncbi:MAG: hypothetical protein KKA73_08915 [Chloroflexi bacterium]|nr:hypothetical protein [Chloroflexota bacterium]MBU1747798.1 hypothetical protein [Chloroflexota bacterium]
MKWKWANTGKEGGVASFHAGTPPSPIYAIYPSYPDTSFRLSDVIQVYGDPSHIMADSYHPPDSNDVLYDLRILYLSQGFWLEGYGGFAKPTLSADTSFEYVSFFVPGEEGLLVALDGWAAFSDMFVLWQGMRDFDYYCRDERGNPCP